MRSFEFSGFDAFVSSATSSPVRPGAAHKSFRTSRAFRDTETRSGALARSSPAILPRNPTVRPSCPPPGSCPPTRATQIFRRFSGSAARPSTAPLSRAPWPARIDTSRKRPALAPTHSKELRNQQPTARPPTRPCTRIWDSTRASGPGVSLRDAHLSAGTGSTHRTKLESLHVLMLQAFSETCPPGPRPKAGHLCTPCGILWQSPAASSSYAVPLLWAFVSRCPSAVRTMCISMGSSSSVRWLIHRPKAASRPSIF
jgi:hypothetical protein